MGHRALVAYERADGRYDLHYSHWGAADLRLAREITPETPLGGPPPGAGKRCPPPATGERRGSHRRTAVDSDPIASGVTFEGALRRVDFLLHEAFYVVDAEFGVRAYLVFTFGVPTGDGLIGDPGVGRGALVAASDDADDPDDYLRGWFDGAKTVVGELVDAGVLPGRDAAPLLYDELRRFVGEDRELVLDPARGGDGSPRE